MEKLQNSKTYIALTLQLVCTHYMWKILHYEINIHEQIYSLIT